MKRDWTQELGVGLGLGRFRKCQTSMNVRKSRTCLSRFHARIAAMNAGLLPQGKLGLGRDYTGKQRTRPENLGAASEYFGISRPRFGLRLSQQGSDAASKWCVEGS